MIIEKGDIVSFAYGEYDDWVRTESFLVSRKIDTSEIKEDMISKEIDYVTTDSRVVDFLQEEGYITPSKDSSFACIALF